MRTYVQRLLTLGTCIIGCGTIAHTSAQMNEQDEMAAGPDSDTIMRRMDSDGDGKISKEEYRDRHEEMFEQLDQNQDGSIDEDEMRQNMPKNRDKMRQ